MFRMPGCCWGRLSGIMLAAALSSVVAATGPLCGAESGVSPKGPTLQGGVRVILGLGDKDRAASVVQLARNGLAPVYFQSADPEETAAVRKAADKAGLLGNRVFVDDGDFSRIHLADNLAGVVTVAPSAAGSVADKELLRVLHPGGVAVIGDRRLTKPFPEGTDSWSHFFHGPDNNPQSTDRLAKAPYLTQFLAKPLFCPMPEISAAAGGRVFRAFGHIAHKKNQNPMLNTLICSNAFTGAILWQRPLSEDFMIHRNTMIATPETLYLADDRSCKLIDPATGEVRDEILVPPGVGDGPVWKWMALVDGVLYALVGGREIDIAPQPSETPGLGHWPWGMWTGHDYANPKTNFGFGRTFVAFDPKTKKVLWTHNEEEYVDSRGTCMFDKRIYFYAPGKFLGCLDAHDGKVAWKNADAGLLEAIGLDDPAQHYVKGYSTTAYAKCNDKGIFFAGPQRTHLVAASVEDGRLLWQKDHGNFQLVLRDDALYAVGPQLRRRSDVPETGFKFDYATGKVLGHMPMRRACTRATGTVDSIFYRANGGTVRLAVDTQAVNHIAPMRPACHDGVIVSDGHLYWGPWMCGCQLSLYGHICLAPAGDFDFQPGLDDSRLTTHAQGAVEPLEIRVGDWPAYQGDNARSCAAKAALPKAVKQAWKFHTPSGAAPTAPVTGSLVNGDGMIFFGDRSGAVTALRAKDGTVAWREYTSGAVYFPPALENGRLFVGSADGRVYAFEAATGKPLWTFRLAPAERWIPVYGSLISTWPVAGGVVVEEGTVYAAAGIAHYDGTHVVALDAVSGKPRWYNDTSGVVSEKLNHGVSLQGSLSIEDGELRFVGGGVHELARYDLKTGRCLNKPFDLPESLYHTAFSAYYPEYGRYLSLNHMLPDRRWLVYDITYEGSPRGSLALLSPLPQGQSRIIRTVARWRGTPGRRRGEVWKYDGDHRFGAFIIGKDVLIAAGHTGPDAATSSAMTAIDIDNGKPLWRKPLPAQIVKGGLATDHAGHVLVSLENGEVNCWE